MGKIVRKKQIVLMLLAAGIGEHVCWSSDGQTFASTGGSL